MTSEGTHQCWDLAITGNNVNTELSIETKAETKITPKRDVNIERETKRDRK